MSPSVHDVVAGEAVGEELAVEVPDGEPVGGRVELGVRVGLLRPQRVEVGDEVAADPVHVDERLDVDLLLELRRRSLSTRVDVARATAPARTGTRHGAEDVVVEAVARRAAARGSRCRNSARLGALDDAVVVGQVSVIDLANAELGQRRAGRRPGTRPGSRCAPTPTMTPWPGMRRGTELDGADGARVGEA